MLRRLLQLSLVCVGCSSGGPGTGNAPAGATVQSCVSQFSPSAGYGWDDDLNGIIALPDGGAPAPVPPQERAASDCLSAGQPTTTCDASLLMTREAALCVAKLLGLPPGIAAWKAGITYNFKYERIIWNVQSILQDDGQGTQQGAFVAIDAIDGKKLGEGDWGSTP